MHNMLMKLISLDGIYFIFCIIYIDYIISFRNCLDIAYFIFITFYYLRIKVHRYKNV